MRATFRQITIGMFAAAILTSGCSQSSTAPAAPPPAQTVTTAPAAPAETPAQAKAEHDAMMARQSDYWRSHGYPAQVPPAKPKAKQ